MKRDNVMRWTCPKCYGAGRFKRWSHHRGGRCFRCQGTGRVTVKRSELLKD